MQIGKTAHKNGPPLIAVGIEKGPEYSQCKNIEVKVSQRSLSAKHIKRRSTASVRLFDTQKNTLD